MHLGKNLYILTFTAALAACGGGGGGSGSGSGNAIIATPSPISLTGTATRGAPLAGAAITLIDATGKVIGGITADNSGKYSVADISSLTAPILISATASTNGLPVSYYSIVTKNAANTVANITPLTDAIVAQVAGKSAVNILNSPTTELPKLNIAAVDSTSQQVVSALSNVLDQLKTGTSATFNPISSVIVADGKSAGDKINDLIKVVQYIANDTTPTIDLIDKSNASGTSSITAGSSVEKLAAIPDSATNCPIDKIADLTQIFNDAASTTEKINSSAFADIFDDAFLNNGNAKSDTLQEFRSPGAQIVGMKITGVNFLSTCDANSIAQLELTALFPSKVTNKLQLGVKYSSATGKWLYYGNQFKFEASVDSSLKYSKSKGTIVPEFDFNVITNRGKSYYNSASATFQQEGKAPDLTIYFKAKGACPTTASNYYSMPIDSPSNVNNATSCDNWMRFTNESTLNTMNSKIQKGKYTITVKAWPSSDRSGTPDVIVQQQTDKFLTSTMVPISGFPDVKVNTGSGTTLPYLSIANASDFTTHGTTCISSSTQFSWCNFTAKPNYTTSDPGNSNIFLPAKVSGLASDGWTPSETIKTYFLHVKDKYGRNLFAVAID